MIHVLLLIIVCVAIGVFATLFVVTCNAGFLAPAGTLILTVGPTCGRIKKLIDKR